MANQQKDRWDHALIIAQIVGSVFTPIAVAVVGALLAYQFSSAMKEREISAQEMTQALNVLRGDENDELKTKLHSWAMRVLNHNLYDGTKRTAQVNSLTVAVSDKETAENLCYKPAEILMIPAEPIPKVKVGDNLMEDYGKLILMYKTLKLRNDHLIRSLNISCGYLNKTPEQLNDLIDSQKSALPKNDK